VSIVFSEHAWEDYLYWQKHDRQTLRRINDLIRDIRRHPYDGIGKPEPLRHALRGYWSRRIAGEHRLVYRVVLAPDDPSASQGPSSILIAQARYHY